MANTAHFFQCGRGWLWVGPRSSHLFPVSCASGYGTALEVATCFQFLAPVAMNLPYQQPLFPGFSCQWLWDGPRSSHCSPVSCASGYESALSVATGFRFIVPVATGRPQKQPLIPGFFRQWLRDSPKSSHWFQVSCASGYESALSVATGSRFLAPVAMGRPQKQPLVPSFLRQWLRPSINSDKNANKYYTYIFDFVYLHFLAIVIKY